MMKRYVPQTTERRDWETKSGAKTYYIERNREIRRKYHREGKKIGELAGEYGLSTGYNQKPTV